MAKFLLGVDLHPYNEEDEVMVTFRTCMKNALKFFGNWEPGASLVAALATLPSVHWQDPVLRLILDGEDVDDERGKVAPHSVSLLYAHFSQRVNHFVELVGKTFQDLVVVVSL